MKKYLCVTLFHVFFLSYVTQAQEKHKSEIVSKSAYAEKLYIQLSNSTFNTDNTVWFKCITTDITHLPTPLSDIIHVELIDFNENIIASKLLKNVEGITSGSFYLDKTLLTGKYLIRAYTEWNKNFDTDFITQKYIDVQSSKNTSNDKKIIESITISEQKSKQLKLTANIHPELLDPKFKGKLKVLVHTENKTDSIFIQKGKKNRYNFEYELNQKAVNVKLEIKSFSKRKNIYHNETITINKNFIDLQFFPEGGKLIDGITSKVAFKALNYKNKGILVKGFIIDEKDSIIVPFKSNKLGMGTTYLKPNNKKQYYAKIKDPNNVIHKYKLPKTIEKGVVINIKEKQDHIIVNLKTNQLNYSELFLSVQSRGIENYKLPIIFNKSYCNRAIEKHMLPEGIIKFSITNQTGQIVCERLFFNYKENDRIKIEAKSDFKNYAPRNKTILELNTEIPKTNLSVLVIDQKQLGNLNNEHHNILSYFLLESDLKGEIENPSYYFNPKNNFRKQAMDALMLTQGWRNYKYQDETFIKEYRFLPEKKLIVSGKAQIFSTKKKLKKPIDLTLIYNDLNMINQQIDSTGHFKFYLDDYYKNKFKIAIQSKTQKGKKKNLSIVLDKYQTPIINYLYTEKKTLIDTILKKQTNLQENSSDNFIISNDAIALEEVELDAYKLTPLRKKMFDLHGAPDIVIENDELIAKTKKWHFGLFSLLQDQFSHDIEIIKLPEDPIYFRDKIYKGVGIPSYTLVARDFSTDFTFVVIDGIPVKLYEYPNLDVLPVTEIKSIELIKYPKNEKHYFFNSNIKLDPNTMISILSIYTYAQQGFIGLRKTNGMYVTKVQGLAPETEFYAPKYKTNKTLDSNIPDIRSIVHWEPNVKTNNNGNAKIEFYNGDNTGNMLIIIEGINKNGKLGYYETNYKVNSK